MNVVNLSDYQQFSQREDEEEQYISDATILLRHLLL